MMTYEQIKQTLCGQKKGKLNGNEWVSFSGNYVETAFEFMCRAKGRPFEPSTDAQNVVDHIDYWVDGTPVDVKAPKHRNKNYTDYPKEILVELTNVNGLPGWLRGKSKYIVFCYDEHPGFVFLIYDREKLLKYVEDLHLDMTTRNNRQDQFAWILPPSEGKVARIKCEKYLEQAIVYYKTGVLP